MPNSRNQDAARLMLAVLLVCTIPSFAQESACSVVPPEASKTDFLLELQSRLPTELETGTKPWPALLPVIAADTESLWRLMVGQGSWHFDWSSRTCAISVVLVNIGEERIRGAGVQAKILDGSGTVLASTWKLTDTMYLEAHASASINLEIRLEPDWVPASVVFEAVQVMGSCGW